MNYLNKVISILALVSITYGLTIGNLLGQGSSAGTITGIVMDVSGAVMPGVMVSVQNVNTNLTRSMKTDNAGVYFFTSLPVGVYELQARAPGFKNIIVSRVRLDVNATLREDFHMQVGEVSQNVTVNAETPLLNTANASLGAIVERKEVEDLPLNGRDFTQLEFSLLGWFQRIICRPVRG